MSLLSSIPVWGWVDIFSTALVLVGVLSEWPWAIKKLVADNPNSLMPIGWKREKLKKKLGIVLIIGVAGELSCLPFSIFESAALNKEAGDAKLLAENIGTTNVQLVADNLVAQSNLAVLEADVQWRTITPTQETNIVSFLKGAIELHLFNPTNQVFIRVEPSDVEACWYARRIFDVLTECGIKTVNDAGMSIPDITKPLPPPYTGLGFLVKSPQKSSIAGPVLQAFRIAGILPDVWKGKILPFRAADGDLVIVVGHKPEK